MSPFSFQLTARLTPVRWLGAALVALSISAGVVPLEPAVAVAGFEISVVEFPIPTHNPYAGGNGPAGAPYSLAAGPDGNVWFAETFANKIGKVTPDGIFTEYPLPASSSRPASLTAGPDGNMWFTEAFANKIGKVTPAGAFTEYPVPTRDSLPNSIAAGVDGSLWFTEVGAGTIGKVTPGGSFNEYSVIFPDAAGSLKAITPGPDAKMWFVASGGIGAITSDGGIAEYSVPPGGASNLTAGPDGNLWFTSQQWFDDQGYFVTKIDKMTPSGSISEYQVPIELHFGQYLPSIAAGPDGNLWFLEPATDSGTTIGRITPDGSITEFPLPMGARPELLTRGPDEILWFADFSKNTVGRLIVSNGEPS